MRLFLAFILLIRPLIRQRAHKDGPASQTRQYIPSSDVETSAYRYKIRRIKKYQNRLMSCNKKMGAKMWYDILNARENQDLFSFIAVRFRGHTTNPSTRFPSTAGTNASPPRCHRRVSASPPFRRWKLTESARTRTKPTTRS
jgi:hypothetical protein